MKVLTQRHRTTCGHTAAAIITGRPYNEIMPKVAKIRGRKSILGSSPNCKYPGVEREHLNPVLEEYGYRLGRERYFEYGKTALHLPFNALINVRWKKTVGGVNPHWHDGYYYHWVVWDSFLKRIIDPAYGKDTRGGYFYNSYHRIYEL